MKCWTRTGVGSAATGTSTPVSPIPASWADSPGRANRQDHHVDVGDGAWLRRAAAVGDRVRRGAGGAGDEHFAETADEAAKLIAGEVEGLLPLAVQAASLTVRMSPYVLAVQVINDLTVAALPDGVMVELGSLYAGETRKLVLTLAVPGIPTLGLAEIATLELGYVPLPALEQQTITLPLQMNVVPGDQAAGRIPDPVVRTEAAFQRAQQAKREASSA